MITKEEFLKAIEALKQQNAVDDNFQTHMEAAFPGSYAPIYENLLWTLSVHLLELLMEDPYKYIDWWVWKQILEKNTLMLLGILLMEKQKRCGCSIHLKTYTISLWKMQNGILLEKTKLQPLLVVKRQIDENICNTHKKIWE